MRVSFISALALSVAAMMPLQGSGEQNVGGVSTSGRRSSLDTPSLFVVGKKSPSSASAAMFGIPRGGAAPPATAKTQQVALPKIRANDIFSKEKIGWSIALGINLIYLFFFFQRRLGEVSCDYAAGGFCVTNYDVVNKSCPLSNSHTWAFIVDCIYTYLGIKAPTIRKPVQRWGLIFTIFGHGALHAALGLNGCGGSSFPGALALFTIFAAGISYAIVRSVANFSLVWNLVITAISAFLTVFLAGPDGSDGISSIFLITQLLTTLVVSATPDDGAITEMAKLGNAFIWPSAISLLELLFCCGDSSGTSQGIFNKLGGHVWYDVTLHRCILLGISDGVKPDKKK